MKVFQKRGAIIPIYIKNYHILTIPYVITNTGGSSGVKPKFNATDLNAILSLTASQREMIAGEVSTVTLFCHFEIWNWSK
jgi:hypothetical protein